MATPVLTDMKARLAAAAGDVTSARDKYQAALELRDELVVAAIDHGMSLREVARLAGVASSRVCAILSGSQPDNH